ncbi:SusC/RagA family TonB-linked outer membrane protein [Solitalea sp. MAHUQ-68]|uniref:SusC/RagA family TonB-linked outer membrane protein n=1 Tax=Solitalea agri TaxID=2953739 RepID=A0A9X2F2J8_9SPHI|nr:SusC/RagA family TonB-linked outer membrane protein [Solitalea agri]MCO4293442.1 SusC/RagA family TonB-linked outer membrane protein [Solitalea agri]
MKEKFTKFLVLLFSLATLTTYAQQKKITGTVTSKADGLPLPAVSVTVKGTSLGSQTDVDGKYSISVPENGTLMFSYVGFQLKEVKVGSTSVINIALESDERQLGEVVVTALGINRQAASLGYSTAKIKAEDLTRAKSASVVQSLNGKVSGLQINTVNSGVNPTTRIVLRGNRSLTGNNQALIVLDGVIVPSNILNTINPDDIENVSILKGSNASALYGSEASNGAMLISTKKGTKNKPRITYSNVSTIEQISYLPSMQDRFGSGSAEGIATYDPIENQQYGPAFDGTLRPLGRVLEDGSIQEVTYKSRIKEKTNFFDNGLNMQNNIAMSTGNENSLLYFSYQNVNANGTVPGDQGKRNTFRLNGTKEVIKDLNLNFNASYAQNRADVHSNNDRDNSVYWNVINAAPQVPLTSYKDWRNDKFSNPNGYYNDYYFNPYYKIDNFRTDSRNDFFIGSFDLNYKLTPWMTAMYRLSASGNDFSSKEYGDKFTYSDFAKAGTAKKDVAGYVTDRSSFNNQVTSEIYIDLSKKFGDFTTSLKIGNQVRQNAAKYSVVGASALVNPGLFNVSNRTGELAGSESNYKSRSIGLLGNLNVGYKDYLFLEVSGRNDWVSVLAPENRSFFYPGVNLSYVLTQGIDALKNNSVLTYAKVRGGWSKTGQVNLASNAYSDWGVGVSTPTYGAYALFPTYGPQAGFPYGSLAGYTISNRIVSNNLKPEFTTGYELGAELGFWNDRLNIDATYYKTSSTNQTVGASVSNATGYSSYLFNTGELTNEGVEADVRLTPIKLDNGFRWNVGFNYSYNENKVVSISDSINELALTSGGDAQVYAIKGQSFPVIKGSYYERDPEGRVIVDAKTGYPVKAADQKIFGSSSPKHKLGVTTSFEYKNFTLSGVFEYRGGYVISNNIGSNMDFTGASGRSASFDRQRFVYPNSVYKDPATGKYVENKNITVADGGAGFWANAAVNTSVAENYITSGAYWKVRELVLSYNFPQSVISKMKVVKGMSLSLIGRNLFTWTPKSNMYTDPEYSFTDGNGQGINTINQTPPTRTFGGSLSVTF